MKTLGIVGGMGPEATIDYYRLIVASYVARSQALRRVRVPAMRPAAEARPRVSPWRQR